MAAEQYTFEIEGNSHTLYFGMTSVEIFQEKSFQHLANRNELTGDEDKDKKIEVKLDAVTAFVIIIYSGLCNQADRLEVNRPSFIEAFDLTEEILPDQKLQTEIYATWHRSKPVISMLKKLDVFLKKNAVPEESQS